MSKIKGELWAACILVAMTTGTALAQSPEDPSQPVTTDEAKSTTTSTTDTTPAPNPAPAPATVIVTPPPPPPAPVIYQEREPGTADAMKRIGMSLSFGGGLAEFTNQTMRDTTGTAGTWAVRATLGTKSPLGFEGSYIGSAQTINALGIENDAMLVGNGVQGALRLNAVIGSPITPFVFGGVAWNHYSLTNTATNTSAISDTDDLLEVPVGLGIGGSWKGLGYDVRGEMRFATNEDLVPQLSAGRDNGSHADMHRWGVNATLGWGF
jgi:hypothetical protein